MIEIFYCSSCSRTLDSITSRVLKRHVRKIKKAYTGVTSYEYAKGYHDNLRFFLVALPILCECGSPATALFNTRFMLDPPDPPTRPEFKLVHVEPSTFSPLEGLHHGGIIRVILERFLTRWRSLASHTVICTPFIGAYWRSTRDWKWIISHVEPLKLSVITRPRSAGRLKREPVFKEPLIEVLANAWADENRDGIAEDIIYPFWIDSSVHRFQKFHAKFYAGVFHQTHVEVLHTSYNIFEGQNQQLENLAWGVYHPSEFVKRFLYPLGISTLKMVSDSSLELADPVGCVVCSLKDGTWTCRLEEYSTSKWEIVPRVLRSRKNSA